VILADRLCNEQRYERSVTGDVWRRLRAQAADQCAWSPGFDSRPRRDHRASWAAREPSRGGDPNAARKGQLAGPL